MLLYSLNLTVRSITCQLGLFPGNLVRSFLTRIVIDGINDETSKGLKHLKCLYALITEHKSAFVWSMRGVHPECSRVFIINIKQREWCQVTLSLNRFNKRLRTNKNLIIAIGKTNTHAASQSRINCGGDTLRLFSIFCNIFVPKIPCLKTCFLEP